MVCHLPLLCDFMVYYFVVPLQREIIRFKPTRLWQGFM